MFLRIDDIEDNSKLRRGIPGNVAKSIQQTKPVSVNTVNEPYIHIQYVQWHDVLNAHLLSVLFGMEGREKTLTCIRGGLETFLNLPKRGRGII